MTRIRTHTNPFNFYQKLDPVDYGALFKQEQCVFDLEIGCGRGVFARAISQKNTKRTLLAIDIRKSVITLLEDRAKAEGLSNLVAIHASAERCLEDLIKDEIGRAHV